MKSATITFLSRIIWRVRDFDQEPGVGAGGGFHGYRAAVRFHGALDDRQPEACALDFVLRMMLLYPVETPEDMGKMGGWNPDPVVGHPDMHRLTDPLAADFHRQFLVGILFEGVLDEIEENLGPVKAVAMNRERRVRDGDADGGSLALYHRFEALDHIGDA